MQPRRLTALAGLALGMSLAGFSPSVAAADTVADSSSSAMTAIDAASSNFAAFLSGGQETPPNDSPAWSYVVFSLNADGSALTYSGRVFGLASPTGAHLHLGALGVAGPIVVPLHTPGQPGTQGCVDLPGGAVTELSGTATSAAAPGCESVLPSGTTPNPAAPATFRTADQPCRQLVDGSFSASGAGLCGFADISGAITAANLSGPLAGKTLADLMTAIGAGVIYINLHTVGFPAGEIRGQLISTGATM